MARTKSADQVASKWARVTPQRTQDFTEGVENPVRDWAANARAAEESYKQGVQAAAQRGSFGKGVQKAGTEKWKAKTMQKGPGRWAEGVSQSAGDFQQGFEPYRQVIEGTQLPPRFPKGDPRNIERVRVLAGALHKKKTS